MPIDERRQEILKAEETVRALAGELANHSTASKELRNAKDAVSAVQADLDRSTKALTNEASRVSELGASLVKQTEELKTGLARLATTEQVKTELQNHLSKLVTTDALQTSLAPIAKEQGVGDLKNNLENRLKALATTDQLAESIKPLEKLVTRALIAAGMAAFFGLAALIHGFLRG